MRTKLKRLKQVYEIEEQNETWISSRLDARWSFIKPSRIPESRLEEGEQGHPMTPLNGHVVPGQPIVAQQDIQRTSPSNRRPPELGFILVLDHHHPLRCHGPTQWAYPVRKTTSTT